MKKTVHDKAPSTLSAVTQASRLVRRKAAPIALEQRFMFDGAAVVDATAVLASGDHEIATQDTTAPDVAPLADASINAGTPVAVASTTGEEALFALAAGDADAGNSKLEQGLAAAQQTLLSWAGSAEAGTDVGDIFAPQDTAAGTADSRTTQLLQDILSSDASVSIELRDHSDLLGSMGAFSASGPAGAPVIYLNRDWVESTTTTRESITSVVVEEYGHYLDSLLNAGSDAAGDEGEAFANRLLQESTSEADSQRIATESDTVVVQIDGQDVQLELASLLFSTSAYFAEDAAVPGSGKTDLEGNSLRLLGTVNAAQDAVKYLFNSDPASAPVYSGNNVRGTLYAINSTDQVVGSYYGEISRLVKTGSTVQAGQFYVYADPAQPTVTGNPSTTILIDFNTGGTFASGMTLGTSSDPVDAALNKLLPQPTSPAATADTDTAYELGGVNNGTAPTDPTGDTAFPDASGGLLSNDTGTSASYTIAGSPPSLVVDTGNGLKVTQVSSNLITTNTAAPATGSTSVSSPSTVAGKYGTLTVGADGTYVYAVNNTHPDVEALRLSTEVLLESFTYRVTASNGLTDTDTLTVTIKGLNDNPEAAADYNVAKESLLPDADGNQYSATNDATGTLATGNVLTNDADVDRGDTKTVTGVSIEGSASASTAGSATLTLTSTPSSLSSLPAGTYPAYQSTNGTTFTAVYETNGTTIATFTKSGSGSGLTFALSDGDNISTGVQLYVERSPGSYEYVGTVNTVTPPTTNVVNVSGVTGTVAIGMTVSGTGLATAPTITAVNYDTAGDVVSVQLSASVSLNNQSLTFNASASSGGTITGQYGALTLYADGSYSYRPIDNNPALSEGDSGVDVFNYTMRDTLLTTSSSTLTITVLGSGANDPNATADTATAVEAGGTGNATGGSNAAGNVLTNDSTPAGTSGLAVTGARSTGSLANTAVATGSGTTTITGLYGVLTISGDGTYSYAVNNDNPTVQALRLSSNTLTDSFLYTVGNNLGRQDVSTLNITIEGNNDAPVALNDTAFAKEAGGAANATAGANPTGNVLTNDTDVDAGDTKSVTQVTATDITTPATTTISAGGTAIVGKYGTLAIHPNGTYTYTVDNSNPAVDAIAQGASLLENFSYQVTDTLGLTHTATLTITINGAGDVLGVNDVLMNEGSPYAVFTVTGAAGQAALLSLTNASGDGGVDAGGNLADLRDGSANLPTIQYLGGSGWTNYDATTPPTLGAGGQLLVRVAIAEEQESDLDGMESFRLVVTTADGTESIGTAGIVDDGTGDYFAANDNDGVSTVPSGVALDDDRALSVSDITVNEGSPYAVFTVTGAAGQLASLSLADGTATGLSGLQVYDGSAWVAYTSGTVALDSAGQLLVRTALSPEQEAAIDNGETFTLTATNTGGTNDVGTATVKDDGTGAIFKNDGTQDNTATKDDDRALSVSDITVNEGSPYAVFTVSGAAGQLASLALADGTATGLSGLQVYDGSAWVAYTSGTVALDSTGTLLVRTALSPEQEAAIDNGETFTLTATNTAGTNDVGTATVKDDGTGAIFKNDGTQDNTATKDDDRALSVSDITVNEGSPYAVFTVTGAAGQLASLSLADGTATGLSGLQVYDGSAWVAYTSGTVALDSTGTLLVRTALSPEQEAAIDNGETFTLTATNTGGTNDVGTATVKDDGTGAIFKNDGTQDNTATKDDDRALSVSDITVNEGSPYAVFTVSGAAGQLASLSLADGTATGLSGLQVYDGSAWVAYTSGTVALDSTGTLLVRTALSPEQEAAIDNGETFTLTATNTGGTNDVGTATVKDDGTGAIFKNDGTQDNTATKDDDRAITVAGLDDVSEGSNAVFTVSMPGGNTRATEIALALSTGSAEAEDYSALTGASAYYFDGATKVTLTITAGKITLPTGVSSFFVSVPSTQDGGLEGAEAFSLSATVTGGKSADDSSTILDDGSGKVYDEQSLVTTVPGNDDRAITVTGLDDVSEGSNAIFTVALPSNTRATEIALALSTGSAEAEDYSALTGASAYYFDGATKVTLTITDGKITLPAGVSSFFVSVPSTQDSGLEGAEAFSLSATVTGGKNASDSSTILDDGSGKVYDEQGLVTTVPGNDDRAITVAGLDDVSEGSNAVFTVSMPGGNTRATEIALALSTGSAEAEDYSALAGASAYYFDGEGTKQLLTITEGKITLPAGVSSFFVSVPSTQDSGLEGAEAFSLSATVTGGKSADDSSTILDDGSGKVYDEQGLVTTVPGNDDRAITVTGLDDVSEGSNAVFTVSMPGGNTRATEIALALSTGSAEADDYSALAGASAYYFDGEGTKQLLTITEGKITLPAGVSSFFVSVPSTQDSGLEGAEAFSLSATVTGGKNANDSSTILDDGSGKVYDEQGLVTTVPGNDDRALAVTSFTVNEGSPYAVFTVSGAANQLTSLSLANGTTTSLSGLQVYNGSAWVAYTSGNVALNGSGQLLVRTALSPEQEATLDSGETFTLTATNTGGGVANGTATVRDDGTGTVFNENGSVNTAATLDDDRAITVAGLDDVSEGSNAVFTVSMPEGNARATEIGLALSTGTAGAEDYSALAGASAYYFDGEGLKVTLTITAGKITLPAGISSFFVSVPSTQDAPLEGAEAFSLSATVTGGKNASDSSTILDDGSGKVYDERGLNPAGPGNDDRPVPVLAPEAVAVEAPVAVVPTPETSIPHEPLRFDSTTFVAVAPNQQPQLSAEVLALIQRNATETEVPLTLTRATGFQVLVNERQSGQLELHRAIDKQFVETGAQGSIALPIDTFTHSDPAASITLAARLSDGQPLPSWVSFDPRTGTFKVVAPAGYVGELDVEVSARDNKGNEVKTKFRLTVGAKPAPAGREGLTGQLRQASKTAFAWRDAVRGEPAAAPAREAAPAQRVQRVEA